MFKKVALVIFIIVALLVGSILVKYYSLPEYTFDTENQTFIKNGVVYKSSNDIFQKYVNNEIVPIYEKPIGRLKGDNPLGFKTFMYKFEGISEEEAFMITAPEMIYEFYEKASK